MEFETDQKKAVEGVVACRVALDWMSVELRRISDSQAAMDALQYLSIVRANLEEVQEECESALWAPRSGAVIV